MTAIGDPYRLRVASVRVGAALSYAVCALLIGYTAATWGRPHGGLTLALAAGAAFATFGLQLVPVEKIVSDRRSSAFFLGWSAIDLAFISALCVSAGGAVTAMVSLYFLPLVFAAVFYPPRPAIVVVALTLACYVGVGIFVADPAIEDVALIAFTLGFTGALCILAAREQEQRQRDLERLSRTDALTGCLNRRGFDERFGAELATSRREGATLALVLLDLDGFKNVNDTLGHAAGDELLVWVVSQLAMIVRPGDTIGRLGGDEFGVVLPRTGYAEAELITDRVRAALARRIPATTGISCAPGDGGERETLQRVADAALYDAKAARVA